MPVRHICIHAGIGGILLGFERAIPDLDTVLVHENFRRSAQLLNYHRHDIPITVRKSEFLQGVNYYGRERNIDIMSARYRKKSHWNDIIHAAKKIRPRFIAIEALANVRGSGLTKILQDLWSIGYDAEWHIIPSGAFGCAFRGDRCWILSYPNPHGLNSYGEFEKENRELGKQLISPSLFNEFRNRFTGKPDKTEWAFFDKPRILREDDRVSLILDRARVKILCEDVAPNSAQFIGTCITNFFRGNSNCPPCLLKTSNYSRSYDREKIKNARIDILIKEGVSFSVFSRGSRVAIDTLAGPKIDYWPASDTYWDRVNYNKSKKGVHNLLRDNADRIVRYKTLHRAKIN